MTDSDKNKQHQEKPKISPVVAGVTGAVVGATVAVAGTAVLKDKKKREKIKQVLNTVKNQARSYMEDLQEVAEDKTDQMLTKGQKASEIARDKLPHSIKDVKETIGENK